MIGDIKDFTRGYRFASNHFDNENDKQKAIDYLYIVSDSEDCTNFDRGIKEFLSFNKLTPSYEPCFGVLLWNIQLLFLFRILLVL